MTSLQTYQNEQCFLEAEWIINIQTPVKDLDNFAKILGDKITLKQGNYSHCMYIRRGGHCRFMENEGAHGGAESAVQEVDSAEIIIGSMNIRVGSVGYLILSSMRKSDE